MDPNQFYWQNVGMPMPTFAPFLQANSQPYPMPMMIPQGPPYFAPTYQQIFVNTNDLNSPPGFRPALSVSTLRPFTFTPHLPAATFLPMSEMKSSSRHPVEVSPSLDDAVREKSPKHTLIDSDPVIKDGVKNLSKLSTLKAEGSSQSGSVQLGVATQVSYMEGSPMSLYLQLQNEAQINCIQSQLRGLFAQEDFKKKMALKLEPKVGKKLRGKVLENI